MVNPEPKTVVVLTGAAGRWSVAPSAPRRSREEARLKARLVFGDKRNGLHTSPRHSHQKNTHSSEEFVLEQPYQNGATILFVPTSALCRN